MAARLAQVVLGKQKLGAAAVRRCEVKRRAAAGRTCVARSDGCVASSSCTATSRNPDSTRFFAAAQESAPAAQRKCERERTCFRADAAHADDQRGCMRQAARAVATQGVSLTLILLAHRDG